MLKQTIKGEKSLKVKYHGEVKFLIFECNSCHKNFEKQESYFRKQSKTRQTACCFCSPECRTEYFTKNKNVPRELPVQPEDNHLEVVKTQIPFVAVSPELQHKKKGFFDSFKNWLNS